VKKTDPNDARNLALYVEKDLLPDVRMKDETQAQLASLTRTRWSSCAQHSRTRSITSFPRAAMEQRRARRSFGEKILAMKFDPLVRVEMKITADQIRSLNQSIAELENTIADQGSNWRGTDSPAVNNKFSCSLRTDAPQTKLPLGWRSVSRRRLAIGAVSCRSSASTTAPCFYGKRFAVD
jgi:hypothetical protein